MEVETPTGPKKIKDLAVGDLVLSIDENMVGSTDHEKLSLGGFILFLISQFVSDSILPGRHVSAQTRRGRSNV